MSLTKIDPGEDRVRDVRGNAIANARIITDYHEDDIAVNRSAALLQVTDFASGASNYITVNGSVNSFTITEGVEFSATSDNATTAGNIAQAVNNQTGYQATDNQGQTGAVTGHSWEPYVSIQCTNGYITDATTYDSDDTSPSSAWQLIVKNATNGTIAAIYREVAGTVQQVGQAYFSDSNGYYSYYVDNIATVDFFFEHPSASFTETHISDITLSGGANVVTPTSTTDHAITRWDGTGGGGLLDSGPTIADDGTINVQGNSVNNVLSKNTSGPSAQSVSIAGALGEGYIVTNHGKYYDPADSDFGDQVNSILEETAVQNKGVTIWLPPGDYALDTPIDLDNGNNGITILGSARTTSPSLGNTRGTALNATNISSSPAIKGGQTGNIQNITLKRFSVYSGGDIGIKMGNHAGGYAARFCHFENLHVSDFTGIGFQIERPYGTVSSNLYARSCGAGFNLVDMNAATFSQLTARESTNTTGTAISVSGGQGKVGPLYIESNQQGAIEITGQLKVGPIYLENNNVGNSANYGINIDPGSNIRGVEVGPGSLNAPANPYGSNFLNINTNVVGLTFKDFEASAATTGISCGGLNIAFINTRIGGGIDLFATALVLTLMSNLGTVSKTAEYAQNLTSITGTSFLADYFGVSSNDNSHKKSIIGITNTSLPRTITLETTDCLEGKKIIIKDTTGGAGANNITVVTEGAETIDGASSKTISNNYGNLKFFSDGNNWFTY